MNRTLQMVRSGVAQDRSALWSVLYRLFEWPFRVMAARQVLSQLGQMSDHELSDIGLMRQDLRDATALEADADPTTLFARRVRERRPR